MCHNIRKALPKAYYEQPEDKLMGYKEVTTLDYFNHLDEVWCKMNTKIDQKMTAKFHDPLCSNNLHITKFSKHLGEREENLSNNGTKITGAVKLQFYLDQMIDSAMFSKHSIIRSDKQDSAR